MGEHKSSQSKDVTNNQNELLTGTSSPSSLQTEMAWLTCVRRSPLTRNDRNIRWPSRYYVHAQNALNNAEKKISCNKFEEKITI
jgi:hypothetical protein